MIKLENITKTYSNSLERVKVLDNINVNIKIGEIVTIIGKSGSGKTTLLSIIGTMLKQDKGLLYINNDRIDLNSNLDYLRQNLISFVFQDHLLLPEYRIIENIMLPSIIAGKSYNDSKNSALELLNLFNLENIKNRYPNQTSRGEKQRVSLLRAMINKPKLILADEPTGNLDKSNCELLLNLIVKINNDTNTTILIATHDKKFIEVSDITYNLKNGALNLYE